MFKTKWPAKFSLKSKKEFILFLDEEMKNHQLKGILIFDSASHHAFDYPTKATLSSLEIVHAPIDLEGDLYILEYLSVIKNKHQICLITSDRELANQGKRLKVNHLSSDDFFSLVMTLSNRKKEKQRSQKPTKESKKEIERLTKIFEDRV